jgi:hypothetical protein
MTWKPHRLKKAQIVIEAGNYEKMIKKNSAPIGLER